MVAAEAWIGFVVDGGTCCICYSGLKAAFEDKTIGQMNNIAAAAAAGAESIMLKDTSLGHVTWDSFPNVSQIATNIARHLAFTADTMEGILPKLAKLQGTEDSIDEYMHPIIHICLMVESRQAGFQKSGHDGLVTFRPVFHSSRRQISRKVTFIDLARCMLEDSHRRNQRLLCHVS
jgi:hypothetical protein